MAIGDEDLQIEELIYEDLSEEIEAFVRLNRFGLFNEGAEFFEATLKSHVDKFPVVAEYADFLLEQGQYGRLAHFLQRTSSDGFHIKSFAKDEVRLLELMKLFAELHIRGNLRKTLNKARHHWSMARRTVTEEPSEAEIQFIEIYLRIVVFTARMSNWLQPDDFDMPWAYPHAKSSWEGFEQWCRKLSKGEYLWEAQKIFRILLGILPIEHASLLFRDIMKDIDEKEKTEPALLAKISILTAYFDYVIHRLQDMPGENIEDNRIQLQDAISLLLSLEYHEGRPSLEARMVDAKYLMRPEQSRSGSFNLADFRAILETARRLTDFKLEAEHLWMTVSQGNTPLPAKSTSEIIEDITRLRELHLGRMSDYIGWVDHLDRFIKAQMERPEARPLLEELHIVVGDSPARQPAFDIPLLRFNETQNRFKMSRLLGNNSDAHAASAEANKIRRHLPPNLSELVATAPVSPFADLRLEKIAHEPMTMMLGTSDDNFDEEPKTVTGSVVEFAFGDVDRSYFATSYPYRAEYAERSEKRTIALWHLAYVKDKLDVLQPRYIMNIAIRSPNLWFMYCYRGRFGYDSKWFPAKPIHSDHSVGAQLATLKEDEIDQISYCAFGESLTTYFLRSTDVRKVWHPRLSQDVPMELYNAYQEMFITRDCPRAVTFGKDGTWILYGSGKRSFKWSKHGLPKLLEAALRKGHDGGLTINKVVLNRNNSKEYVLVYDEGPVYYSFHKDFVDSFKQIIDEWSAGMRSSGRFPNHVATFPFEDQFDEETDYDSEDDVQDDEQHGGSIIHHRRPSSPSQPKMTSSPHVSFTPSSPPRYNEIS